MDRRIWVLCGLALVLMGAFVALYNYFGFRLVGPVFRSVGAGLGLLLLQQGEGRIEGRTGA